MTKILISLASMMLLIGACSGKQKRICNQNVAYQHGYQAAQKGEDRENASTFQGNICQDFEAYSPTLYKQDFRAGYEKGKKDYCSEFNYKKWGTGDGNKGLTEFPNSLSVEMAICLKDSKYKAKARKTYDKAFKEAYCSEERLTTLGQDQAKAFKPLKVPNIKKLCNKKSNKMITAMRKAYKEQMKTNCTTSFWLVKGEEDAKAKKSKSTEMAKAQKCSANVRDKLINSYSSAYNERKALMLEEEKLAFEKQKQKERMELERQRQRQQYELERERIGVIRDAVNGPGGRGGHGSAVTFYHKGSRISSRCHVDSRQGEARILVKNESNRHVSINGRWRLFYYDQSGRQLRTREEYEHLSLSGYEQEEFEDRFPPSNAVRCVARLKR